MLACRKSIPSIINEPSPLLSLFSKQLQYEFDFQKPKQIVKFVNLFSSQIVHWESQGITLTFKHEMKMYTYQSSLA